MAPTTWATMKATPSASFIRPVAMKPMVTAGLMWQPEMGPMA